MRNACNTDAFDVLVVGAGIAGCEAALAAAESGAHVALVSAGQTFSGSSFFPGTWGLGLVGPNGEKDEGDLASSIIDVGRGMAVPELVRALVRGVAPAVARLEDRDVELIGADNPNERDFIPCFDRTCRCWHGLGRASYRAATTRALERADVTTLPHLELLDLLEQDGRVCGALFSDLESGEGRSVCAGAVVLATGGFGGLFSRTLTMPDVMGTAAAVALRHGARLVNVEFIQIMPGLVGPVGNVVFNERTFRYARVEGFDAPNATELLDSRGGHGPFTASLPDRVVDLAFAAAGERGAAVSYDLPEHLPEFMQTYFSWFEESFGRSADKDLRIAPYAHASNGGILVDEEGFTGVPGLYACGEATGGMHGADRIGGLSSANGLVFGHAAGRAATRCSAQDEKERPHFIAGKMDLRGLRHAMDEHCLLNRTDDGLRKMDRVLDELDEKNAQVGSVHAANAILSARALVTAMLARTESRGAHYRADFPHEDPAQARPLVVTLGTDGRPVAEPLF